MILDAVIVAGQTRLESILIGGSTVDKAPVNSMSRLVDPRLRKPGFYIEAASQILGRPWITVCKNGAGVPFSEEKAKEILLEKEICIIISVGSGEFSATAWGCDLTYDYVKINGDYRT